MWEPVRAWLGPWSKAVYEHHERWDGKGYPQGLTAEHIPVGARILIFPGAAALWPYVLIRWLKAPR